MRYFMNCGLIVLSVLTSYAVGASPGDSIIGNGKAAPKKFLRSTLPELRVTNAASSSSFKILDTAPSQSFKIVNRSDKANDQPKITTKVDVESKITQPKANHGESFKIMNADTDSKAALQEIRSIRAGDFKKPIN